MKSLIAINLVVQDFILLYTIILSGDLGGGGAQNSVSSSALTKQQSLAAIASHDPLFPFEIMIGFFSS